jgi:hypothetical protein
MNIIVFESEAYYKLLAEQIELFKQSLAESQTFSAESKLNSKEWLTESEAKEIIPYRSKTKWQDLRDQGAVEFAQFGRKILYSKKSLYAYISKNKIN